MLKSTAEPVIKRQSEALTIKLVVFDVSVLEISSKNIASVVTELSRYYKVACTSDYSYQKTLETLEYVGINAKFDLILSANQIKRQKPSPEIYYRTCLNFGFSPKQVLVFDSSDLGRNSCSSSGCHLYEGLMNLDHIFNQIDLIHEIQEANPLITQWQQNVQVIVPLFGLEDEFIKSGFGYPGPFVEVNGNLMLQNFVENLNMEMTLIFVIDKIMYEKYNMKYLLENLFENSVKTVLVDSSDFSTSCSQILACKEFLDTDVPVIVTNCTQYLEWDSNSFLYSLANPMVDAGVLTFQNTHPRYAYVGMDKRGWITRSELYKPFSSTACAGVFYWKKSKDLLKYCSLVVAKGRDVQNKYGVALAMDEAIKDGKRIKSYECRRMWELSTPKDLEYFHMVQQS